MIKDHLFMRQFYQKHSKRTQLILLVRCLKAKKKHTKNEKNRHIPTLGELIKKGLPDECLPDQDTNFTSQLMMNV